MSAINIPESYFHTPTAQLRPGEPNARELRELTSKWITNLRASKTGRQADRYALAYTLEGCEPLRRCHSAACPNCSAAAQRLAIDDLTELWPDGTPLVCMTMVVASLHRPVGELASIELGSIKRHLQRKFTSTVAGVPVWGYIDLSHNVHSDGLYEEHWAPHLAFVTLAEHGDDLRQLKANLHRNDSARRPHHVARVNNWDRQVSYISKFRPIKRVEFERLGPGARPSKYWLNQAQTVEYLLWASEYHPIDRFFLLGMRRFRNGLQIL